MTRGEHGSKARPPVPLVAAIDIGNTFTKVGIVDTVKLVTLYRMSIPSADAPRRLAPAVADLLSRCGVSEPLPLAASCVLPRVRKAIPKLLDDIAAGPVHMVGPEPWLPITVAYQEPARLGPDRLAMALCCHRRYPGRSCAIVAAGTTVTVDYVRDGRRLEGGAILPGIGAQLSGLHQCTGALPLLKDDLGNPELPGTTTEACIAAGVLYGLTGGIERIVAAYRTSGVDTVVATGGAWPVIAPHVAFEYDHFQDAALIGTAMFGGYAAGITG